MKNNMVTAAILSLALLLLGGGPAISLDNAGDEIQVIEKDTSVGKAIGKMITKLPEVWRLKEESKRIARTLPDYEGAVATPDSDTIFSWLTELCRAPHRRPGTAEDRQAEEFVAARFREFGLENVSLDPVEITVWTAEKWSLTVGGEEVPGFFVLNTGFTPAEGITAPLVYVGEGGPDDFAKVDARGKIVVAEVPFPYLPSGFLLKGTGGSYIISDPDHTLTMSSGQYLNFVRQNFLGETDADNAPAGDVYWNSYKAGAAAVCLILRDQPSRNNTHYGPYDGIMKPLPGLWIGKYDGERLRELARAGSEATLTLTGTMAPGVMRNVWGALPGMSDEIIMVTSHHDAPFTGASEDGAGTVQVLAQAWAWSQVPREQRPRTLVFVVDGGHFYGSLGAHRFAKDHPEIMARTKILLTMEHLAAKEVIEQDGEYVPTGDPALTVMFTSADPLVIAGLRKALQQKPARRAVSIPADFFGKAPTSDAAGYVLESNVPVISWIGCPYYLLDSGDTLDKIEIADLQPVADTAAEIVKVFMAMP